MELVSFQTRARTVDHLGREQIADCPTAVSELWKNAYDAYAKNVDLHIFDGQPKVAAITDDGHGMTKSDILNNWLVLGTEHKIDAPTTSVSDRNGLPIRRRQGEKGIGRLSAAFLAPVSLLISKHSGNRFAMTLVDWRLFENPYLNLEDLVLPVEECDEAAEIVHKIPAMVSSIVENLTGSTGSDIRKKRLAQCWRQFDKYEKDAGRKATTSQRIAQSANSELINERHLSEWPVYLGLSDHGTALFLINIHRELSVWTEDTKLDDEGQDAKELLKQTLTGFVDPFSKKPPTFAYEVLVHTDDAVNRVLSSTDKFGIDDLEGLEHVIEGAFDKKGRFKGTIRAFGKDRGVFEHSPARPFPVGKELLGPFAICVGTFEQTLEKSSHDEQGHAALEQKAETFSGIGVYRDELRVLPYGRPKSDFFGIEERRTKNLGREFWVHRRCFGRVAFTQEDNPNLRDKAGREGLIDNQAARELRLLVVELLKTSARRFFGSDSDIRIKEMPEIQARNRIKREAAEKARRRRSKVFRTFLEAKREPMRLALEEAGTLLMKMAEGQKLGPKRIDGLAGSYERLLIAKDDLQLPPSPARMGDQEPQYRLYRDSYKEFKDVLSQIGEKLADVSESGKVTESPEAIARSHIRENTDRLHRKIQAHKSTIQELLGRINVKWHQKADLDAQTYNEIANPIVDDLKKGSRLSSVLNILDAKAQELEESLLPSYLSTIRALEQITEDIDIDSALSFTEDDRSRLEDQLKQFSALAQVGISVELIGHELETMDSEVERNLKRLPSGIQESIEFRRAYEAHRGLTERLRFLAPLKIAGYRTKDTIKGKDIGNFLQSFFRKQFETHRVTFMATEAFSDFKIVDLSSRIYPVFTNLISNALYWVNLSNERKIICDRIGDKVIVADSGPGVDPEDVDHLFQLFFTRRSNGRGLGLYLCKANLVAGGHDIKYAGKDDSKILEGANFILEFKGIKYE